MQNIKEVLADNPQDGAFVDVSIAEFVDLVDSIKTQPTTEVGKQQLAGARKSAEALRGQGGVCQPTAGHLRALLDMAPKPPAQKADPPTKDK